MPATARLAQMNGNRCWVLTTVTEGTGGPGPEILTVQSNDEGRVCLTAALQLLYNRGIRSLMVEGGANVITAFLKMRLADALVLTIAPRLVGGYKAVSDLGISADVQFPALAPLFSAQSGADLVVWGNLQYGKLQSGADNA
jgi:3,4-dihydroxy 2-butanone 4-phosphate synthase/GTP cyclohydrolase II